MELTPEPHPLLLELADELIEAVSAAADGFRAMLETPVNQERVGHAIDRLDEITEALREMRAQQTEE